MRRSADDHTTRSTPVLATRAGRAHILNRASDDSTMPVPRTLFAASHERVVPRKTLANEITRILQTEGLTQTAAAQITKVAPTQLSLIVTGKLAGFSVDRLLRVLSLLGRDIEIHTSPAKRGRGKIRVRVE